MQDASVPTVEYPSGSSDSLRRLKSHQFGEIEIHPRHVLTFAEGLFGFENLREFILISQEETEPLKWLLSLDDQTIGFPVINPLILDINYRVAKGMVGEDSALFVIITLSNVVGNMTANMKAPVIINANTQEGKQIIISSEKYSTELQIGGVEESPTSSMEG